MHCVIAQCLVCYCECLHSVCSSYCRQLNAVSFSTALHAALCRSIYSLLTGYSLGTLQGFLGALAKFLTVTVSFVMSDGRLSVCMEQLCSDCVDFHEILYLKIYCKYWVKIKVSWKSEKNSGYLTWRTVYIHNFVSLNFSSNEKSFRQKLHRNSKQIFYVQ